MSRLRISEKKEALITLLSAMPDNQERLAYLVDRARQDPPLAPVYKTDTYRIEGCLSKLWLVCEFKEGKCFFKSDSDSLIVKAIASLLADFYSGQVPAEILSCDPSFLSEVNLTQHLSANRRNALSRLWEKIHDFASRSEIFRGNQSPTS
jgi:cysteine desulfuration protein SufE